MDLRLSEGSMNHANIDEEDEASRQRLALTTSNYGAISATTSTVPPTTVSAHEGWKIELVTSYAPHCERQTEPPLRQQIVIETKRTRPHLNLSSFQISQLRPINLSLNFPETRLSHTIMTESLGACSSSEQSSSHRLHSVHSSHRKSLRLARQQVLGRIGMVGAYTNEKRLLAAVRENDTCTVIRLLDDGVSPNVSDSKQRTPLHIAASQGLDHIVSTLMANRADPNNVDILGNSPLHLAICRGDMRTVRILVGSGADIHKRDRMRRTPLDIIQSRLNMRKRDRTITTCKLIEECHEIIEILKLHAARLSYQNSSQVDALCDMMAGVTTREQADEFVGNMLDQMSDLSLKPKVENDKLSMLPV